MDNGILTSAFADIRQRLMALAKRMLGNEEDAEDTVQDAFCRLWQRREKLESRQEVEGTSFVTVRNLCVDNKRRNSKMNEVSLDDNSTEAGFIESDEFEINERMAVYTEVKDIMNRYLSDVQRQVILLREYEGKSYDEISEQLGIQPATARMHVSRARKLIREIYRNKI